MARKSFEYNDLPMPGISQKFPLHSHPAEMEPLLPGEHRLGPLLEQAHDLMRSASRLAGMCQPEALLGLRDLLRAMHSYYSNKIEGQHTLPAEIEQALRNDYASDADKARRQRLALPTWPPKPAWNCTRRNGTGTASGRHAC